MPLTLGELSEDIAKFTIADEYIAEEEKIQLISEARYSETFLRDKYVTNGVINSDSFDKLKSIDPSKDKKYLEWLLRTFNKGNNPINKLDDLAHALYKFYIIGNRNIISGKAKDINSYKTYADLIKKMDTINVSVDVMKPVIDFSGLKEHEDYDEVFNNDKALVVVLKTFKAAKQLCDDSYCIQHDEEMWNRSYEGEDNVVYLIYDYAKASSQTDKIIGVTINQKGRVIDIRNNKNLIKPYGQFTDKLKELDIPESVFKWDESIYDLLSMRKFNAALANKDVYYFFRLLTKHKDRLSPKVTKAVEQQLSKDAFLSMRYAQVLEDRFPEGEKVIAKDPNIAYQYAVTLLAYDKEVPKIIEDSIARSGRDSLTYALYRIHDAFPQGEQAMSELGLENEDILMEYVKFVADLGKKITRPLMLRMAYDGYMAYKFAQWFTKGRFPEGEKAILKSPLWAERYVEFLQEKGIPIPDNFSKYNTQQEKEMTAESIEESKTTVKRDYLKTGKITQANYNDLLNLDPTKDEGAYYFDWIVKQFLIRKSWENEPSNDLHIIEDMYKDFKELLKKYDDAVDRKLLKGTDAQIYSYIHWKDIEDRLRKLNVNIITVGDTELDFSGLEEDDDYEIVEENLNAVVAKILTYRASKQLGSDTWCIVKGKNMWDDYSDRQFEFYFVFNLDEQQSKTNRVWAIAYSKELAKVNLKFVEVFNGLNNDGYQDKTMPGDEAKEYIKSLGVTLNFNHDLKQWLKISDREAALKSAKAAFNYARDVIEGRFPEGEEIIANVTKYAYFYARDVIKGRFPEGEEVIASDPFYALLYAETVIKGRWPEGEKVIASDPFNALLYKGFLSSKGIDINESKNFESNLHSQKLKINLKKRLKENKHTIMSTTNNLYYDRLMTDPPDDCKVELEYISPDEYIQHCADIHDVPVEDEWDELEQDRVDRMAAAIQDKDEKLPIAVLDFVKGGQDGRHRAGAFKKLDVKDMPVLMIYPIEETKEDVVKEVTSFIQEEFVGAVTNPTYKFSGYQEVFVNPTKKELDSVISSYKDFKFLAYLPEKKVFVFNSSVHHENVWEEVCEEYGWKFSDEVTGKSYNTRFKSGNLWAGIVDSSGPYAPKITTSSLQQRVHNFDKWKWIEPYIRVTLESDYDFEQMNNFFEQNLTEKIHDTVYIKTIIPYLISLVNSNKMVLKKNNQKDEDRTGRKFHANLHASPIEGELKRLPGNVIIKLDGEKLNQRYSGEWETQNDTLYANTPFIDNFTKYIQEVHVLATDKKKRDEINELVQELAKRNIPFYIYDQLQPFKAMYKTKAQTSKDIKFSFDKQKRYSSSDLDLARWYLALFYNIVENNDYSKLDKTVQTWITKTNNGKNLYLIRSLTNGILRAVKIPFNDYKFLKTQKDTEELLKKLLSNKVDKQSLENFVVRKIQSLLATKREKI